MTPIQTKMAAIHRRIIAEDYYTDRYSVTMMNLKMEPEKVQNGEYFDRKLVELAHFFWESLPDSPSIRTGPFYDLCDVAEHIFDEE